MPHADFVNFRKIKQLDYLFQTSHSERIYQERCEKWFSKDVISFRENIKWINFYDRISTLFNNMKTSTEQNMISNFPQQNKLMELKLLLSWNYNFVLYQCDIDLAVFSNNIEMLEFLEKILKRPYTDTAADLAVSYGFLDVVSWLEKRNIIPTVFGANLACRYNNLVGLKYLYEKRILPNEKGIADIFKNKNTEVLDWALSVLFQNLKLSVNKKKLNSN